MRVYGAGGYLPAAPNGNLLEAWDAETGYTKWDADGVVVAQRALTPVEIARETPNQGDTNRDTLHRRVRSALTANSVYVASTPTPAQNATQIKALSLQVSDVIRLLLGVLDGVD